MYSEKSKFPFHGFHANVIFRGHGSRSKRGTRNQMCSSKKNGVPPIRVHLQHGNKETATEKKKREVIVQQPHFAHIEFPTHSHNHACRPTLSRRFLHVHRLKSSRGGHFEYIPPALILNRLLRTIVKIHVEPV